MLFLSDGIFYNKKKIVMKLSKVMKIIMIEVLISLFEHIVYIYMNIIGAKLIKIIKRDI